MPSLDINELINSDDIKRAVDKTLVQFDRVDKGLKEQREEAQKTTRAIRESLNSLPMNAQGANAIKEQSAALTEETQKIEQLDTSIQNLSKTQEDFNKQVKNSGLGSLEEQLDGVGGAASGAIGGIKAFGASLKALLLNPVVLLLTGIAATLKLLFDGFKRSAQGATLFNKAAGALEGTLSLITRIASDLATLLVKVWENPTKAIKELGNLLVSQILNRGKAIIDFFSIITDIGSSSFDELAERAKVAFIQLNTGFDKQQQQDIIDYTNEVVGLTDAFIDLAIAQREVRRQNREIERGLGELIAQEEELNIIADDQTRSFAEREAAAEMARESSELRLKREVEIARNTLGLLEEELKLRRANGEEIEDLADRQLEAFQAVQAAERAQTNTLLENEKVRRELVQDRLERDLDILIDGFDNQKTINERLIADEDLTLKRRRALLEETERLSLDSFDNQIDTIQKFTDQAVNANELLATSDAVVLNERIRALGLSEIIEGRLLEVIRDRRTAIQDLSEANRDLSKSEEEAAKRSEEAAAKLIEFDKVQNIERLKLGREFITARVEAEIDLLQFQRDEILKNDELTADERLLIEKQFEADKAAIRQQGIDDEAAANRERINSLADTLDQAVAIQSAFFDFENSNRQQRLEEIRATAEEELDLAEGNSQRQEEIQKKLAAEERTIKRQQAEAAKKQAQFVAATELIIGIARAIASAPFPANLPAIAFATINGGLQVAAANAIEIPAFAKGVKSAPGGMAIVGEEGIELARNPSGKYEVLGSDGPALMDIAKGTRIFNNAETMRMMNDPREIGYSYGRGLEQIKRNRGSKDIEEGRRQALIMAAGTDYDEMGMAIAKHIKVDEFKLTNGDLQHTVVKGANRSKDLSFNRKSL